MTIKKRLQQLVRDHLKLINHTSLDLAEQALNPEQWQSFWEVIAQRYIDECYDKLSGSEVNTFAPDETWNKTWDALSSLYPQYILKVQCEH